MEKQIAKYKILKALFSEAKRLGIDQETLREDVAPGVINKRLSAATPQEVARVLVYIHNRHGIPEPTPNPSQEGNNPKSEIQNPKLRYESSRAGLLEEIRDLAIARFGEDYALPLNAFCARFGETDGFRRMRVSQMKRVKQRLKELQQEDPRNIHRKDAEGAEENPSPDPVGDETLNTKQETQNSKVITFQKGRKGFYNQLGENGRL